MGVGRNKAKRYRVIGGTFNLAAQMHAAGVAVDQQAQQDSRVMGRRAASGILTCEILQIQSLNYFDDEACQMVIGQPLVHRWRQQVGCVSVYRDKAAHCDTDLASMSQLSGPMPSVGTVESPTNS